jgi:hypothetical protein
MKGVAHACKAIIMVQDAVAEVVGHGGRRRHWRCEAANPGIAPGADHAREKSSIEGVASSALLAGQAWVEPIESGIRGRIRERIEELVEQELVAREKRRTPRDALAFWDLQVFAFARLLSATGEKLCKSAFPLMPAERRESLAASPRRSPPKPPKSSPPVQPELFRSALVNLVDPKHPLVRLAGLID